MSKFTSPYPSLSFDATGTGIVSHGGAATLLRTADAVGLTSGLSNALSLWRKPLAHHDPGKIILDLAVSLALGGDCLSDIATLREHRSVFGTVASDPTVSRLITTLAAEAPAVLTAIDTAPKHARSHGTTLANTPPTTRSTQITRSSMISTPPWSPPTLRKNRRNQPTNEGSGFTH